MSAATPPPVLPGEVDPPNLTERKVLLGTRVLSYLVLFYLLALEVILLLGFILLLFGANPDTPFVEWAYRSLDRAMEPFRGIFTPISLGTTPNGQVESILETSVLFAMVVYGIIALAAHALVTWLGAKIDRIDREARDYRHLQAIQQATAQQASVYPTTTAPSGLS